MSVRPALITLALVAITGCQAGPPEPPGGAPRASVGAHLEDGDVSAALEASAAAGPARFRSLFSLKADGYFQTMSRTDGVIDLAASRGLAITEDLPGQALATKREVALEGDQVFGRSLDAGRGWENRSGGARSFVDLDAAGASVIAVIETALPDVDRWVVVGSEQGDPPDSTRIRPVGPDVADVTVVIDRAGRLVSIVVTSTSPAGNSGASVHELTFTEFGVPIDVTTPS